jgi:hypothetical protein
LSKKYFIFAEQNQNYNTMKKILLILVLVSSIFLFTACPFPSPPEPTLLQCVTAEHGWILAEGSITPAYRTEAGDDISDLMDFLSACEKDDVIFFDDNGVERIKTNVQCAEGQGLQGTEVPALWHFDNAEDPLYLYMQLPFFYEYDDDGNVLGLDPKTENCKMIDITKDEFQLIYTDSSEAGTYKFNMIFRDPKKVDSYR